MQENPIPQKSLGQHWLRDIAALDSICDSASVQPGDIVLEIGPGLGTLTARLLTRGASVTAVEFDKELAQSLSSRLSSMGVDTEHLRVVCEDILQFDLTSLPAHYKVVANIPYYLTSNLIRVLCESANPFSDAVLMIQKEVAERVAAGPGQMSILSVTTQVYCDVALGRVVSAALFTPPPKVDSQVLVLNYRVTPIFPDLDTKQFFRLVKAGFSQKRKTLENSLSGGLAVSKESSKRLLQAAAISPSARAQELSLEDWHRLYRACQRTTP